MHARHALGGLLEEIHCVPLRQQCLPDRGLLSYAEDPHSLLRFGHLRHRQRPEVPDLGFVDRRW
jgi:hypothetical protein